LGKTGETPARCRHCISISEEIDKSECQPNHENERTCELRVIEIMKIKLEHAVGASLSGVVLLGSLKAEEIMTEETVVVASRIEEPLNQVTESVAVIDGFDDLLQQSLQDEVGFRVPGVLSTSTAGQRGQAGALLIRGTTTSRAQLRVDGIRVSDSNVLLGNFFGSASNSGIGSVEILKGPQSALYG